MKRSSLYCHLRLVFCGFASCCSATIQLSILPSDLTLSCGFVNFVFSSTDISVRVRGDVQPTVRCTVHATQRDCIGRHARRTVARADRAHQATQLARLRALRVRQEPHVQKVCLH